MYPANPFGDIVVPHEEGIVVNDVEGAEGFDLQQDQFTGLGDVIRKPLYTAVGGGPWPVQRYVSEGPTVFAGDEGVGMAGARNLKRRMLASRRQMNVIQPAYAVEADSVYDTGFGGFSLKRMFKNPFGKKSVFGKVVKVAGKVAPYAVGGLVGGTLFKKAISAIGGTRTRPTYGPTTTDQVVAPVGGAVPPAPAAGPTTDVIGQPAPFFPSTPSPIPSGAGSSATEDVAAAAQSSGAGMEQAGMFGNIDPKMLMLAAGIGLALFAFSRGGGRRRR